ncbi:MAG: 50S ribosomal protein L29 [Myxococcota bacterium]|nr:50S ribosomal protein L29 [Myxococcota bacterium]
MNANELREKSVEDLRELNDERRRELFDLRFKHYTGQLLDTASLKKTRREIARIETVLRELENAQSAGA